MRTNHIKKKKIHIRPLWIVVFLLFLIYSISLILPIVWGFLMSLMSRAEFNATSGTFRLPSNFDLSNYINAWQELATNGYSMIKMLFNSLWFSAGGPCVGLFTSSMCAYVVSKYRFPGRKFILGFTWITLMIPIMGTMASSLRFYRMLNATDSPLYLFASITGLGMTFIYMYSSFQSLSWEYAESAFVDGAGHFQTFFRIMLPQVKPTMVALFVNGFIGTWNDSMTPLIYFPNLPTLATGLYIYQTVASRSINYPMLFAALIMCMIPVLVLFIIFSEKLMSIQLGGGIKG